MNAYIDIYCERTAPGLWAEPLNALTNGFFFIAALCAYFMARKHDALDPGTVLLLVLLTAIGTGSTLFHTLAVRWAALADTIPILLFQLAWLGLYAKRALALNAPRILALAALFLALSLLCGLLPRALLNGSLSYLPALLFLTGFAVHHARARHPARRLLAAAAALFAASLTFRALDMALCPFAPLGVHFIWHILNAGVLFAATAAYILNKPRPA